MHQGLSLPPASLRIRGVHTWHSPLSPHSVVDWLYSRASESELHIANLDSECCSRGPAKAWSFSLALSRRKDYACSVYQPPSTLPEEPPNFFHRYSQNPHLKCTESTVCLMYPLCQPMPTLPGQVQVGKSIAFSNGHLLLEDVSFAVQNREVSNTG